MQVQILPRSPNFDGNRKPKHEKRHVRAEAVPLGCRQFFLKTMKMTIEEMQLAVCEKLVDLIDCHPYPSPMWKGVRGYSRHTINWPTEGLQVCHEAEKIINREHPDKLGWVWDELTKITGSRQGTMSATYEQRLEALCRVWFPEKWKE